MALKKIRDIGYDSEVQRAAEAVILCVRVSETDLLLIDPIGTHKPTPVRKVRQ